MAMQIDALGHVVLRVRDLDRAEAFYNGRLGIPIIARAPHWNMTFFSLGKHHDFAVSAIGEKAQSPAEDSVGLDHVSFHLAGGLPALARAKEELEAAGLNVIALDHTVSMALMFHDPDGNSVEVYVDGNEGWRDNPELIVAESRLLDLSKVDSAV
jgi:catechol 2,3-dioxygenase